MPQMNNPRNYPAGAIDDALRMKNDSRKVSFRYELLDKHDIKKGTLDGVQAAKVSYGEFCTIKRTATFTLDEYARGEIDFLSERIRPWFVLHMPDGGTVEWPLGIFLLESPGRAVDGGVSRREITAYDETIILEEDAFEERQYFAAGTSYVGAVGKMLTLSGITKVNIADAGATLRTEREFAVGMKVREAVNALLGEINYNSVRADENGYICSEPYVEPELRQVTQVYTSKRGSVIRPKFSESLDLAGRANVFVRVASDLGIAAKYVNADPLSRISTVSRGRRIVDYGELDNIASPEALESRTRRAAAESMSAYGKLTFNTALMPTHGSAETLYIDIPELFDTPAKFSETAWEMDLKFDGEMSHEARRVVGL